MVSPTGKRGKGFKRALDFEEIIRIIKIDMTDDSHLMDTKRYLVKMRDN